MKINLQLTKPILETATNLWLNPFEVALMIRFNRLVYLSEIDTLRFEISDTPISNNISHLIDVPNEICDLCYEFEISKHRPNYLLIAYLEDLKLPYSFSIEIPDRIYKKINTNSCIYSSNWLSIIRKYQNYCLMENPTNNIYSYIDPEFNFKTKLISSNFSYREYDSVAHYINCIKTDDVFVEDYIRRLTYIQQYKYWDKYIREIRPGWKLLEKKLLYKAYWHLFSTDNDAKQLLLTTGKSQLVYFSAHYQPINWGISAINIGLNLIGNILMNIRELLQLKEVYKVNVVKNKEVLVS